MGRVKKTNLIMCIVLVCVLMINNVRADDTTFVKRFDLKSKNLNRQEMETSILYNRVFPFARLNRQIFSKASRDSIKLDHGYWKQVFVEMYNADYEQKQKYNFDAHNSKLKEYVIRNRKLPIGIIHFNYEYIDSNAYIDGRIIKQGDNLVRNASVSKSPYILDSVTNLSILSDQIFAGEQQLVFDPTFIYTNTNRSVVSISINFNDQSDGTIKLIPGDSILYTFTKLGVNTYSYTIVFSNNVIYHSESSVNVLNPGTPPCVFKQSVSTETFTGYDNSVKGCSYEFGIYYSNCANNSSEKLNKPILVLDGFDPADLRKVGNIYDLMNSQPVQLSNFLRQQGHDIIICNFLDGADFIERNALGVIQLLNYINARTTDPITLIGPSMGGLIAKYALAKMEKENNNHNVGLYLSMDAPHQGANIPIGAQYFLYFFGEIIGNAGALEGLSKIKSPAARQMLIHYYSLHSTIAKEHSWRLYYLENVKLNSIPNSNGYPQNSRNIAYINGSETKTTQGIAGLLFKLDIGILGNSINAARALVYASPNFGSSIVADFQAINPNNFYQQETFQRMASVILNNPYPTSLDNAPGGKYDTQYQLTHSNGVLSEGFTLFHPKHNFIPSVSSLDIRYPDGQINYLLGIRDAKIICNNLTPFVAYYAPEQNEDHVFISAAGANWLKREIRNGNKTVHATTITNLIGVGKSFNYGVNTKDFFFDSFTVKDGGVLGINMNIATGYGNEPKPERYSHFKVDAYNNKCEPIKIHIANTSKLQIGHWGYTTAELRISENSILHLDQNSFLEIYDNSKLVIEKGSKLIIGKNVNINLFENNSQIIIEGTLEIEEDAVFSFIGEGHVYLKTNDIVLNKNSKIIFQGKNRNDLVLTIHDGKNIILPYILNSNNLFQVSNARIDLLGTASSINSSIATTFTNCSLNGGAGIYLNGQPSVTIQNCSFNNIKTGITSYAKNIEKFNIPGSNLILESCDFNNNEIAIRAFGKGFDLRNIMLSNCYKGLVAEGIDKPSQIYNSMFITPSSTFNNHLLHAAIYIVAIPGTPVYIQNSTIENYNVGIYVNQGDLNLKCTEVLNSNFYNVWIANGGTLNMSSNLNANAGSNTLSVKAGLNNRNICLEYASGINLANGANKFKIANEQNNYFVSGTMLNIPISINFKGNNWYTRLNTNSYLNQPSQKYFYIAANTTATATRVQNFLLSPILGNNTSSACVLYGQGIGKAINDSTKLVPMHNVIHIHSDEVVEKYKQYFSCKSFVDEELKRNSMSVFKIDSLLNECQKILMQNSEIMIPSKLEKENETNLEDITLFPNPTDGVFEVVLNRKAAKIYSVSIFNLQGKMLQDVIATTSSQKVKLDLDGYHAGMYLVNIKTSESEYIKKIVLMKK
jgi:Secretion system C-terminal sorting domain/Lecithin:cholesterol acyltransferase